MVLTVSDHSIVAGVDEAGRGALAGPVVAAAVILSSSFSMSLQDSKLLTAAQRDVLFEALMGSSDTVIRVGAMSHHGIDRVNILNAALRCMASAIRRLEPKPDKVYIDGNKLPRLAGYNMEAVVKGDQLIASVSAASIVAKVTRDRIMNRLDDLYPGYGFARHKGYATTDHYDALFSLGPSPVHRRSFNLTRQESLWSVASQ